MPRQQGVMSAYQLMGHTHTGVGQGGQLSWIDALYNKPFVDVREFGALGAGGDYTVEIQAAIDSLAVTGGMVYFPRGAYVISALITVPANIIIFGDKAATVITLANGSDCDMFSVANTEAWVKFLDFTLDGNRANQTAGAGLSLAGDNIEVLGCIIHDTWHNAVSISATADVIRIKDNLIYDIGGAGIDPSSEGLGIYGTGNNQRFLNNEIYGIRGTAGIRALACDNVVIENNHIYNTFYRGIMLSGGGTTWKVKGNNCHNMGSINDTGSGVGCNGIFVMADLTGDLVISKNTIKQVAENGIEVLSPGGIISKNQIKETGFYNATLPTPSEQGISIGNGNSVEGNRIEEAGHEGIKAYSVGAIEDISITNNRVINSGQVANDDGILLHASGGGGSIQNCVIRGNRSYDTGGGTQTRGINLSSTAGASPAVNCVVTGNICFGNITGQIVCPGLGNEIFNNIPNLGLNLSSPTELTIVAGVITITKSSHTVDGEGDLADDLDTINGGADGMMLVLKEENVGRAITVRDTVGNIELEGGVNMVLNALLKRLYLFYDGTLAKWIEKSRFNG